MTQHVLFSVTPQRNGFVMAEEIHQEGESFCLGLQSHPKTPVCTSEKRFYGMCEQGKLRSSCISQLFDQCLPISYIQSMNPGDAVKRVKQRWAKQELPGKKHLTKQKFTRSFVPCVSPSTFSRRAVVSYWRKHVHKVLVNRLGDLSLPRKSVVRLTDHPDMTLDVYRGRKTTMPIICALPEA